MSKRFTDRLACRVALSVFGALCMTLTALNLGACSTVEGVGKDIQHASQATADALNGDK